MKGSPYALPTTASFDAIALTASDNVATVLRPVSAGEVLLVHRGAEEIEVRVLERIPFGHKIALSDIRQGGAILKYGTAIGQATALITGGTHVHTHNLRSNRATRGLVKAEPGVSASARRRMPGSSFPRGVGSKDR